MYKMKKSILGITGIRSDYDIMSSVFRAISKHKDLSLKLVVTGAHLSSAYGYTVKEVVADGFTIAEEIENLINGNHLSSRVKGLAIQLQSLVQTVARVKPDMLLVLGDREEALTTAIVGSYMNIPVAHVGGGDRVVGNIDDQVRHAVSKLSHIHFTMSHDSKERLIRLGEQPFRIFNVGNPGLDRIVETPNISCIELSHRLGFEICEQEPFVMLIQHVLSSEVECAYDQMKISLEAIKELGIKTIVSYPNTDAGGQDIIRAIGEYTSLPFLYVAKNIPRLEFINLLRRASCLLGNSSAGILEAPFLKLPVINVGNRQKERFHSENIQFIAHDQTAIVTALRRAIFDLDYRNQVFSCSNFYGEGNSSIKIADILANFVIDEKLLNKDITY